MPPRDIWQCLETFFIITIEGGCYWPRNVEQGIEKDIEQDISYLTHTTKNYLTQNVSSIVQNCGLYDVVRA